MDCFVGGNNFELMAWRLPRFSYSDFVQALEKLGVLASVFRLAQAVSFYVS